METVVRRCAGLDVHKDSLVACVRIVDENGELQSFTQSFGTMVTDLLQLNDWLASYEVTIVGMESTGVYWKPVYALLETDFTCWLLNAQHLHNVPGRKTDVADASWIAQLVAHGLVRPSFVPPKKVRELRELTRYRKALIQERTREAQRLHKILQDSGLKLSSVATDILGKSGRAILQALIDGTHDPDILAELARGRLRRKIPLLRKALTAWFSPTHRILVSALLAHLEYLDESIEQFSSDIASLLTPFAQAIDLLDSIPGVNRRSAEVFLAEFGADMSRFGSANRLASWAGMCPGNNESAGKHFSGKTRRGSKWLRTALTESAEAAARKNGGYLRAQYTRIKGRHGHNKAITAVAHSILVIAFHVLQRQEPYNELGGDYFVQRQNKDSYRKRLVTQLERMGYDVALSERAA
ncbi:MAG: IS110 family transposase [Candidatus Eremiobacteraeota bacterium]|nr:IS110 family transposase [Candidatus Eremiobacteraeota bacterium]